MRVFAGNTGDPVTVVDPIKILQSQWGVQELVFVGEGGMVNSKGKQARQEAGWRRRGSSIAGRTNWLS